MQKIKSGAAVAGTVTTSGTPGTSDQVWTFPRSMRPCIVHNDSAVVAAVIVNGIDAGAAAKQLEILAGAWADVSFGGMVNVDSVSVYLPSGAYTDIYVNGWA